MTNRTTVSAHEVGPRPAGAFPPTTRCANEGVGSILGSRFQVLASHGRVRRPYALPIGA
jgi:hypothetical protein